MVESAAGPEIGIDVLAWPADPASELLTFHLAHPGPGIALPGDPNCAFFWNGRYHLHYIYDRGEQVGDFAFAHVSSPDLVHWRWHPTTLSLATMGHGMFSGTGFITAEGRPAIIYQGFERDRPGLNQIAIAEDDELERWSPPIPIEARVRPDQDGSVISNWDPDAWLEGDTYYAIFGGETATLLTSPDLATWDYVGPFLSHDLPEAAEDLDISCPNFFAIGGEHMLLCISHNLGCRYYLGEWNGDRFTPRVHGRMNWHGIDFFAPESVVTADGRRVMWSWCYLDVPLSGIQSLPRELSLPDDGVLRIAPLRELEGLRGDEVRGEDVVLPAGAPVLVEGVSGDALEIAATIRPTSATRFGIRVHCDQSGAGGVGIVVDTAAGTIAIGDVTAPFDLAGDEEIRLRVFVDKHFVEAFANDRQALVASHAYDPSDVAVVLIAEDGEAIASATAWRMSSIHAPTSAPA
jgi:sucrose-6-phosphate hydrolase SacC (GH32 family)